LFVRRGGGFKQG